MQYKRADRTCGCRVVTHQLCMQPMAGCTERTHGWAAPFMGKNAATWDDLHRFATFV